MKKNHKLKSVKSSKSASMSFTSVFSSSLKNSKKKKDIKNEIVNLIKKLRTDDVKKTKEYLGKIEALVKEMSIEDRSEMKMLLDTLYRQPIQIDQLAEERALRAVKRLSQRAETDDFKKQQDAQKKIYYLGFSHSIKVRDLVSQKITDMAERFQVHSEIELELTLERIARLEQDVLTKQVNAIDQFQCLMNYVDSLSPMIRMAAEVAVETCLSRTVRAKSY